MKISSVAIARVKPKNGLIAFAAIVLDGAFHVGGIAVHEKLDGSGYRLTYPTRKTANQDFAICHPINPVISKAIERAVFDRLKTVLTQSRNHAGHDCHQSAQR